MSSVDPSIIADYRLFGAPLPRADALPRTPPARNHWPRLKIHVSLLDDHWSISGGHWSAEIACRHEQSRFQFPRSQPAAEERTHPSTQTSA
jgi:hypothetical protein